jgi:RNA polymerase sigma factor (sigma-70 family)
MRVSPLQQFVERKDPQAFRELVEQYQGMVYGTCQRILGPSEADDAVQETFIKLARKAADIHSNPGAWLHACARSTALNALKARKLRHERQITLRRGDDRAGSATQSGDSVVDECLDELPDSDRDVIISYFFVRDSQQSIADRIGISQVAVKKRIDRILGQLREKLLRRGLAVPGLLSAFLHDASAQAEIPAGLSQRLAQLDPSQLIASAGSARWLAPSTTPVKSSLVSKGIVLATTLALVVSGAISWSNSVMPNRNVVNLRWDFDRPDQLRGLRLGTRTGEVSWPLPVLIICQVKYPSGEGEFVARWSSELSGEITFLNETKWKADYWHSVIFIFNDDRVDFWLDGERHMITKFPHERDAQVRLDMTNCRLDELRVRHVTQSELSEMRMVGPEGQLFPLFR